MSISAESGINVLLLRETGLRHEYFWALHFYFACKMSASLFTGPQRLGAFNSEVGGLSQSGGLARGENDGLLASADGGFPDILSFADGLTPSLQAMVRRPNIDDEDKLNGRTLEEVITTHEVNEDVLKGLPLQSMEQKELETMVEKVERARVLGRNILGPALSRKNLLAITDPRGKQFAYIQRATGRVMQVTPPFGSGDATQKYQSYFDLRLLNESLRRKTAHSRPFQQ
jgi:hypothetical protein